MRREQLEAVVHAEPFKPFRVILTNGRAHDVKHPEFFMLVPGTVLIGHADAHDGEMPFTIVDLSHIAEVEPLAVAAGTPGNGNGVVAG